MVLSALLSASGDTSLLWPVGTNPPRKSVRASHLDPELHQIPFREFRVGIEQLAFRLSGTQFIPLQYDGLDDNPRGSAAITNRAHVPPVRMTANWTDSISLDLLCRVLRGDAPHHDCHGVPVYCRFPVLARMACACSDAVPSACLPARGDVGQPRPAAVCDSRCVQQAFWAIYHPPILI